MIFSFKVTWLLLKESFKVRLLGSLVIVGDGVIVSVKVGVIVSVAVKEGVKVKASVGVSVSVGIKEGVKEAVGVGVEEKTNCLPKTRPPQSTTKQIIKTPPIIGKTGNLRPGWTPREAVKNGLLVLVDGARLINREATQHYLFTQVYSLIMSEINKRRPANPSDLPVSLVLDEVYSLLKIPGMAPEISQLSPQYRSRKLQLYIVLQELAQMSDELRPHIWSLGNILSFAISNFDEAYTIAQQLFKYEPKTIKMGAKSEVGQPIVEPDRGQYLQITNDLQHMKHREAVMRRYISEQLLEKNVLWIKKTKDIPSLPSLVTVAEIKDRLLQDRGVRVRDALEVVRQRTESKRDTQAPTL